jgi:hypothetical protein
MSDFVTSNGGSEGKSHGVDVVMNEDGTMQVAVGEGTGSEDGDIDPAMSPSSRTQ